MEMERGAAQSTIWATHQPLRPRLEKWDQTIQPVYRPADGAGSQERMKLTPGSPGSIGHGKNLFRLGR